jgi:membrane protein involved in colicin uptake
MAAKKKETKKPKVKKLKPEKKRAEKKKPSTAQRKAATTRAKKAAAESPRSTSRKPKTKVRAGSTSPDPVIGNESFALQYPDRGPKRSPVVGETVIEDPQDPVGVAGDLDEDEWDREQEEEIPDNYEAGHD